MSEKMKIYIISIIVLGIGFFVYFGWEDKEIYLTEDIAAEYTAWQTAEFSETESGIDYDGEYYSETNHWSEPASEVYFCKTIDRELVDSNTKGILSTNDYYFCEYPIPNRSFGGTAFDGYRKHSSIETFVVYKNKKYSIKNTNFNKYLTRKEEAKFVIMHTWYGNDGYISLN